MSYVEHGPRIFLAGRPISTVKPLMYSDYVLPRKRSEGRLKLHDSCSDIRAWSPNSLENTRYFRELAEHSLPTGKIIPFNVIVDSIIGLTSQAQNELHHVKKELEKYKNLTLTAEQKAELQKLDNAVSNNRDQKKKVPSRADYSTGSCPKDSFVNISKSMPFIHSNSYLSIHIPSEKYFQSNEKYEFNSINQKNQLYSLNTPFGLLSNDNLLSTVKSVHRSSHTGDYVARSTPCVEYVDAALQVEKETREIGVQFDAEAYNYTEQKITTASAVSQTSLIYKSNDKYSSSFETDKSSLQARNHEERSSECDSSFSKDSQDIGMLLETDSETESDFDIRDSTHKGLIIEKDSEIIVLKNELCVKEAELEELRDLNSNFEVLLEEKERTVKALQDDLNASIFNIAISREKFVRLDRQRNCEVNDLEKKLCAFKDIIEQLKVDFNQKSQNCYLQSQEIDKLRLYAEEVVKLRTEKVTLTQKLKQEAEEAKNYNFALEQLKNTLREKDDLKKQSQEQSCILADQEDEIKRLLVLINQMSVTYNQQAQTQELLDHLRIEIQNKNVKLSQYEECLVSAKREFSDFLNNLKNSLNNLEEYSGLHKDTYKCEICNFDIEEEANTVLYSIKVIMTQCHNYKVERQELLQQIRDLKNFVENIKQQASSSRNQNLEDFFLNMRQNKNGINEIEDENSISISSENSLNKINDFSFCNVSNDYIEKEIVERVSDSLMKMHCLMEKLQVYIELERPSFIKQMYNIHEILKNAESAVNRSQSLTQRRQRISELCNQYDEEYKNKLHINYLSEDLYGLVIRIHQFLGAILRQELHEVLLLERNVVYDEKINRAFEVYLRTCINRMNTALLGAGEQGMQIVKEITKQQQEMQQKDVEIARLKKEVAQHMAQRGEGDCIDREESKKNSAIKEQLSNLMAELNEKNALILTLQEDLKIIGNELSTYSKDCNILRTQNKNLNNVKNKLSKECCDNQQQLKQKNEELANLTKQLQDLVEAKKVTATMKNNVKELDRKVASLQFENDELRNKVKQANKIICMKDENITDLKNNIDTNKNALARKVTEFNMSMEEKHGEISVLKEENKLLSEKLKDIENKLSGMNTTILSLTEENDKINIIYHLQEDLAKLDKSERKLKTDLNSLKMQFVSDENTNKNLENKLDTLVRESENLKKDVEYWKNENSQLSMKLCTKVVEKSRAELYTIPNKICQQLQTLKHQLKSEENIFTGSNEKQQDEMMYQREKIEAVMDKMDKVKPEFQWQRKAIKENEIEDIETQRSQMPNNIDEKNEISKDNTRHATLDEFNASEGNIAKMRYKVKCLEKENKQKQNELEKLLNIIEDRESEINGLKESINCLVQENAKLHSLLESQVQEYQDKLMLMKRNYDSSLHALCQRHNDSVDTLQKRFEDTISGERNSFDPDSWFQSLSLNELKEIHERVLLYIKYMSTHNKSDIIQMNNGNVYLHQDIIEKDQFYSEVSKLESNIQTRKDPHEKANNCALSFHYKQQTPNTNLLLNAREQDNLDPQNDWRLTTPKRNKKCLNMQQDIGFSDDERKMHLKGKNGNGDQATANSSFDRQRWNFIIQCSTYHKLSNSC